MSMCNGMRRACHNILLHGHAKLLPEKRTIFWRTTRKKMEEIKELTNSKYVQSSNELFEMSEHKIKELKRQQSIQSEQFLKKMIFEEAIFIYFQRYGKNRRGHIQFIYASLNKMKEYDVHQQLDIYKKLIEIFPEEKLIPRTGWQTELHHYPRQQEAALDILCAMEENFVIPDEDFGRMLYRRFGLHTSPMVRYQRMLYWMPKARNLNPWPRPEVTPHDPAEVAHLALRRMNPDRDAVVLMHEVDITDTGKTWIASVQSETQKQLLLFFSQRQQVTAATEDSDNSATRILFVDGPHLTWLNKKQVYYYKLCTEIDRQRIDAQKKIITKIKDDENLHYDSWYTLFEPDCQHDCPHHSRGLNQPGLGCMLPWQLTRFESEQDNEAVLACCVVGTTADPLMGLRAWISLLARDNPELDHMKVVFRLTSRHNQLSDPSVLSHRPPPPSP